MSIKYGGKEMESILKASVSGSAADRMARASKEYGETPINDLDMLNGINVEGHAVYGQANCKVASRVVQMGTTSVTGDFRHEVGHALHGVAESAHGPLVKAMRHEYDAAMERAKANPAGMQQKLSHQWYEENYGVIGRRALDTWHENVAEHYRGYHKAIYQQRHEGNAAALSTYRQRHSGWAKIWDAWYTGALIAQEGQK